MYNTSQKYKSAKLFLPGLIQYGELLVCKSMILYDPYSAECPGLSAHSLPPMESEVLLTFDSANNFDCSLLQTESILDSRVWCAITNACHPHVIH